MKRIQKHESANEDSVSAVQEFMKKNVLESINQDILELTELASNTYQDHNNHFIEKNTKSNKIQNLYNTKICDAKTFYDVEGEKNVRQFINQDSAIQDQIKQALCKRMNVEITKFVEMNLNEIMNDVIVSVLDDIRARQLNFNKNKKC